jgi:hypothetical protein
MVPVGAVTATTIKVVKKGRRGNRMANRILSIGKAQADLELPDLELRADPWPGNGRRVPPRNEREKEQKIGGLGAVGALAIAAGVAFRLVARGV